MNVFKHYLAGAALALAAVAPLTAHAATTLLTENFDNIGTLSGWLLDNRSTPAGQPWFQGNTAVFTAADGAANSYIAASYLSAQSGSGTIDNWLILPALTLSGATQLSFATRGASAPGFNDTLAVMFSPSGGSAPADFTQQLLTIGGANPYPSSWTTITAHVDATGSGRFALRYLGDASTANYIGVDTVNVSAVPEPARYAQLALGLLAVGLLRRKLN